VSDLRCDGISTFNRNDAHIGVCRFVLDDLSR
jgi:hypothetical protein